MLNCQRRALRRAGGAAGELDVDRVVWIEGFGNVIQARLLRGSGNVDEFFEYHHACGFFTFAD